MGSVLETALVVGNPFEFRGEAKLLSPQVYSHSKDAGYVTYDVTITTRLSPTPSSGKTLAVIIRPGESGGLFLSDISTLFDQPESAKLVCYVSKSVCRLECPPDNIADKGFEVFHFLGTGQQASSEELIQQAIFDYGTKYLEQHGLVLDETTFEDHSHIHLYHMFLDRLIDFTCPPQLRSFEQRKAAAEERASAFMKDCPESLVGDVDRIIAYTEEHPKNVHIIRGYAKAICTLIDSIKSEDWKTAIECRDGELRKFRRITA